MTGYMTPKEAAEASGHLAGHDHAVRPEGSAGAQVGILREDVPDPADGVHRVDGSAGQRRPERTAAEGERGRTARQTAQDDGGIERREKDGSGEEEVPDPDRRDVRGVRSADGTRREADHDDAVPVRRGGLL